MTRHNTLWHPFTQHALAGAPIPISHADGSYLYTRDGRRIFDGISSWWVNTHGHCHPKIVAAIQQQVSALEQVIFAGFTHEPAEKLGQALLEMTDHAFQKVFLSDSGSTSVEVALKMALGYWAHRNIKRTRIIAFNDGYHGDTFGAMSASGRSVFNDLYEPWLFQVDFLPSPHDPVATLAAFKNMLADHAHEIAALILEPLVLGAGGMIFYPPSLLRDLADLCKAHEILLIADEVMTGWGRTGSLFACQLAGIMPDLMCLSKGLTGGFLAMGATLATDAIYDAFYAPDRRKMFFHSSSFTGNPLACAAAVASIEIWRTEPVQQRIDQITACQHDAVSRFARRSDIRNARSCGTILAMDVMDNEQGYTAGIGPRLYNAFIERDVLLRPLGNTLYVLPPYSTSPAELESIHDIIDDTLDRFRHGCAESAA